MCTCTCTCTHVHCMCMCYTVSTNVHVHVHCIHNYMYMYMYIHITCVYLSGDDVKKGSGCCMYRKSMHVHEYHTIHVLYVHVI